MGMSINPLSFKGFYENKNKSEKTEVFGGKIVPNPVEPDETEDFPPFGGSIKIPTPIEDESKKYPPPLCGSVIPGYLDQVKKVENHRKDEEPEKPVGNCDFDSCDWDSWLDADKTE